MPRHPRTPRPLVADGHAYLWTTRHSHSRDRDGRPVDCRHILTFFPQPAGSSGPLRVVFAEEPDRYVPGGAPAGSGDVGFLHSAHLNLHEPGAARALLDAALARGWRPGHRRTVVVDGWPLLAAVAAR
ncbi:hypothetical protein QNO07_17425 [Streptomyces sp. 549]|uniref:hypothetical protein n=1 Tax=Streptomyces sp. 549 TaxID=3049076 RepID=UPI0024C2CDB5|nr:hypothetical protein [Streptomyces sp. 549]MDK1475175.1 hypothetical protein [Streptomyces sp. 549]